MKYSGIGGQAVIEGVMMKNGDEYATAVRKPDGTIEVKKDTYVSMGEKVKLFFSAIYQRNIQFCGFHGVRYEGSDLFSQLFLRMMRKIWSLPNLKSFWNGCLGRRWKRH